MNYDYLQRQRRKELKEWFKTLDLIEIKYILKSVFNVLFEIFTWVILVYAFIELKEYWLGLGWCVFLLLRMKKLDYEKDEREDFE